MGGGVGGAAAGDRQPRHQVLHLRPGAEHHMPGLGQVAHLDIYTNIFDSTCTRTSTMTVLLNTI